MPKLRALTKNPPLAKGDAEQQLEELRDYLLQIVEELGYLLTHLEADNINDTTFERISQMIPKAFTGTPTMDGEGSPGTAPTWARGDHTHPKDSSKADVTALAAHIADRLNPHSVTKAQVGLGNVADERQYSAQNPPPVPSAEDVGAIPAAEKGSAGGVAELDANGMVPSAQLPSYVDDVLEYASLSVFPVTGESGKIYVALDTNKTYRWSGSAYTEISESLALGETSSTAYRGDRGKAAYDHSQLTSGNPHNVTAAEAGAVPTSREVNGHALSSDITLDAADVGARSDTWMPSASDVGAQPTITANGILKGDGQGGVTAATAGTDFQAPLTFDATPTANSTNPVQSGGVYTDVRTRVPVYGLGKNLLDNWYFLNAVNQRNLFTVIATNSNVYTLDRWNAYRVILAYGAGSPLVFYASNSGAPTGYVHQWIEKDVVGKQVTASVLLQNGTLLTVSGLLSEDTTLTSNNVGNAEIWVRKLSGSNAEFFIWSRALNAQVKVVAAKLELGTEQTLCHNEGTAENPVWVLNEIPDYEYELYRCITSTADPSDTYANKSLATEQQLAYVETGTTASRTYAVGEYFCWNGLLYRVNTAISSGGTFTPGTNCSTATGGGLNQLRVISSERVYKNMNWQLTHSLSLPGDLYYMISTRYLWFGFIQRFSDNSLNIKNVIGTAPTYTHTGTNYTFTMPNAADLTVVRI